MASPHVAGAVALLLRGTPEHVAAGNPRHPPEQRRPEGVGGEPRTRLPGQRPSTGRRNAGHRRRHPGDERRSRPASCRSVKATRDRPADTDADEHQWIGDHVRPVARRRAEHRPEHVHPGVHQPASHRSRSAMVACRHDERARAGRWTGHGRRDDHGERRTRATRACMAATSSFTPQGGGQTFRVPYAGFKGDYQSIQVLTTGRRLPVPRQADRLWLARESCGEVSASEVARSTCPAGWRSTPSSRASTRRRSSSRTSTTRPGACASICTE